MLPRDHRRGKTPIKPPDYLHGLDRTIRIPVRPERRRAMPPARGTAWFSAVSTACSRSVLRSYGVRGGRKHGVLPRKWGTRTPHHRLPAAPSTIRIDMPAEASTRSARAITLDQQKVMFLCPRPSSRYRHRPYPSALNGTVGQTIKVVQFGCVHAAPFAERDQHRFKAEAQRSCGIIDPRRHLPEDISAE